MSVVFKWNPGDFEKLIANCPKEPVTPFMFKYMPKDGIILEAGCGAGRFVYFLSKLGYKIIGIEIGEETVETLNNVFPELDIRQGDVRQLPFPNDSIDGIISLGVIEHVIQGIDGPIREMYRVLKPNSYAIVIVPSFNYVRRIKYRLGLLHIRSTILAIKKINLIRKIFGKPLLSRNNHSVDGTPLKKYKRWPLFGEFFEYRFKKHEFENELTKSGFIVEESVPTSLIDGIYHEFGRLFVKHRDHTFYPNFIGRWLNDTLSRFPFFHNHMHLSVVRKPTNR